MIMTTLQEKNEALSILEELVDKHSLVRVLDFLVEICFEKEAHVQSVWQDKTMAKDWRDKAKRIAIASRHCNT
jgi:hypothetical protein